MTTENNVLNMDNEVKVEPGSTNGLPPVKRKTVSELLEEPKFHPELSFAEKEEPLSDPIVIYDARIMDWDGDYGPTQYVLFVFASIDGKTNQLGEKKIGKIGGRAMVDKFKKMLRKHLLPSATGIDAMIAFRVSEETGRSYYDFAY